MKNVIRIRILAVLAAALVVPAALLTSAQLTSNVRAGENQNSAGTPSTQTEKHFDQSEALAKLRESIAGKENEPAEKVFKNIQLG